MSKRSCRRSTNENEMHNKAVKIRKMTDEQLVHYVEDRVNKAYSEGYNKGKGEAKHSGVGKFFQHIQKNKIPGVGILTIDKLMKEARENGYVE